ncbi:MAG: cyclic nucleotide-binding protein [Spirochaetaceae bacterium]|nr:MAG: cyclic nucleotide-binding protein [Spirochaetaceae bacterium]
MTKIPVVSADRELNQRIEQVAQRFANYWQPVFLGSSGEALEYFEFELPEIGLINISDETIDTDTVLTTINGDPWLHYGAIMVVYRRRDEARLATVVPNSQIISAIPRGEFVSSFFRVMKIITENRHILFHRDVQSYLTGSVAGHFIMDNDPFNVRTYANLVSSFLYNSNYVDRDARERVHIGIFEMLMNAVEHGNCGISYAEKTRWLESGRDAIELIRSRYRSDAAIRARRVRFSYRIAPERSFFRIRDDGQGFDWRAHLHRNDDNVNLGLHGHGIAMTRHYMENVSYNGAGNEVSFEVTHQHSASNIVPEIFQDQQEISLADGEAVFCEGDDSNTLYYIVSGNLAVVAGGHELSVLTPQDMFLGEMSFLLNDRRSATVVSKGGSVLIPISKRAFVNAIKANPHYGIFLARLLAQRLSRLNQRVISGG